MKLYQVLYGDPADNKERIYWCGTQAEHKAAKKRLTGEGAYDIEVVEVEVPTGKPELLKWLNTHLTRPAG
jgi:hypothetical protein